MGAVLSFLFRVLTFKVRWTRSKLRDLLIRGIWSFYSAFDTRLIVSIMGWLVLRVSFLLRSKLAFSVSAPEQVYVTVLFLMWNAEHLLGRNFILHVNFEYNRSASYLNYHILLLLKSRGDVTRWQLLNTTPYSADWLFYFVRYLFKLDLCCLLWANAYLICIAFATI